MVCFLRLKAMPGDFEMVVTLLVLILALDDKSYYPIKVTEKSHCAAVLFQVKNVTMLTNRTPPLEGVV